HRRGSPDGARRRCAWAQGALECASTVFWLPVGQAQGHRLHPVLAQPQAQAAPGLKHPSSLSLYPPRRLFVTHPPLCNLVRLP
ncbi:uncharacterized protein RHOBADRAFT_28449, partial [Rhodotorula graminis WP1]